jgi:hypothetical protein
MSRLLQQVKKFWREHLLFQYFTLVFTRWQAALWGGSVLAVAFGWHFVTADWPYPVKVTACVTALFFAGYYVWRVDHVRLIPRLGIVGTRLQDTPVTKQIVAAGGIVEEKILDHRTFVQVLPKCLTDAPVYECLAHLQKVQRFSDGRWEDTDLDINLVLNSEKEQYPGSEHPINIFFVQHGTSRIRPNLWNADMPDAKFASIFKLNEQGSTKFRFYIQVSYSDRIDGHFVSTAKPVRVYIDATFALDPIPEIELTELNS